ncbi:MAG: hypothetical protein ACR2MN_00105 [Acidimicrobiales bacterium]
MTFLPPPDDVVLGWQRAYVVTCDDEAAATSVATAIVRIGREDVDDGGMELPVLSIWDALRLADCGVNFVDGDEARRFWDLSYSERLSLWMTDVEKLSEASVASIRRLRPADVQRQVTVSRHAVTEGAAGGALPASVVDQLLAGVPPANTTALSQRSLRRWAVAPPELTLPAEPQGPAAQEPDPEPVGRETVPPVARLPDEQVRPDPAVEPPGRWAPARDLATAAGSLLAGSATVRS